eukprot:7390841-Prymnesium_polylepis.1
MDPIDIGVGGLPKGFKAGVSWTEMPAPRPEAWAAAGVPDRIVRYMTEGVEIELYDAAGADRGDLPAEPETALPETAQYPWRDAEYYARGALECDRAMLAGHLEAVPADMV